MKKAIRYSIIVCLVSWVYAAIMIFGFNVRNILENPMKYTIMASLYMLLPMIVAIVMQILSHVETHRRVSLSSTGLLRFNVSWLWLVAWMLPVVVVLLTILVNMLMPGCEFNADLSSVIPVDSVPEEQKELFALFMNPAVMIVVTIVSGLFAGVTINAVFAFGEEYGWRNYLVDALREKKFVCATVFIGLVWGLWHFPLILLGHNYPQHSVAGVFMMVIFCVLASFIETYLVIKAKSVFPAAIFHGTLNAVAGLNVLVIKGGNDLINGMTGLSGFVVMAIVIMIVYVFDRYILKDNIFSKTIGEALDNGER